MATQRKISPLSDHVINQIAAGEVIERPLSIVKELVENSLDAGASVIEVRVESGGSSLISVRDNGHGIAREDLTLAVQRHCTSKLSNAEQLQQLNSLGFRGEALASIAAVSELSLSSRTAECTTATEIVCSYGELSAGQPTASYPVGTLVSVENLFANTPARRKFLRQARTENLQISQLLKHIAFSHRQVSLSYFTDGKKVFNVAESKGVNAEQRRLRDLFGKEFAERALPIERSEQGLKVSGWIGPAELHRPRADIQFISVNGRVVRDRTLVHAIRLAYDGTMPEGRYASYALDITLAPDVVDVNVHPTKTEVRFAEPRHIHDQIYSFVSNALSTHLQLVEAAAGEIVSTSYEPNDGLLASEPRGAQGVSEPRSQSGSYARKSAKSYGSPRSSGNTRSIKGLFSGNQADDSIFGGLYFRRFLLVNPSALSAPRHDCGDKPTFVDLEALLESLFNARLAKDKRSRPLIVAETLPPTLKNFYAHRIAALKESGLVVEELDSKQLVLKEVPLVLLPINHEKFLSALAANDTIADEEPTALIAAAAATAVLVPADASAQQRWFQQILEQLRAANLRWQDYCVIRSETQWQNFLSE